MNNQRVERVNLEEAKEALEVRVKDRVKELEKFQKFAVGRELKMIELKKEIKNEK